jgi:hypothetical protein
MVSASRPAQGKVFATHISKAENRPHRKNALDIPQVESYDSYSNYNSTF